MHLRLEAKIVLDSCHDHPNIDPLEIEKHITLKTKVIVPVHYAGVACDMETIMKLANQYKLYVVEDATSNRQLLYFFQMVQKKLWVL